MYISTWTDWNGNVHVIMPKPPAYLSSQAGLASFGGAK